MGYGILGALAPFLGPTIHPGQSLQIPPMFFDHFMTGGAGTTVGHKFATTADAGEWLVTADNGGSNVISDAEPGGVLTITPGTAANDFRSLQLNGEAFALTADKQTIFAIRMKSNDTDDLKFFVGLATTDITGTTAGPILDGVNDSIGFRNVLGNTAAFLYVAEDDTTETTGAAGTMVDDTFITLMFICYGTEKAEFYVDGVLIATIKSGLPDDGAALTLTMEVGSPTGTTATNLEVDWILAIQEV